MFCTMPLFLLLELKNVPTTKSNNSNIVTKRLNCVRDLHEVYHNRALYYREQELV